MIYVGTVSNHSGSITGNGKGIYTLKKNKEGLVLVGCLEADNAGIIRPSKDRRYVYVANETKDFGGINGSGGGITACRIKEDGTLEKINDSISYGSRTAFCEPTEDNKYLLVANHGSHTTVTCSYVKKDNGEWELKRGFDDSSVALFSLSPSGSISRLLDLVVFQNKGYWCHGGGQSTSHIHCVRVKDDLIFACNRGADEIEILKIDRSNEKLILLNSYHVRNGYAPRYLDFHPAEPILYVVNENYPSVSVYRYDQVGNLSELQTIGTMPGEYYTERPLPAFTKRHADPDEKNTCGFADRQAALPSDIHITDDGMFLYVSNRAPQGNIAVFRIQSDYTLELQGNIFLEGRDPRGFAIEGNTLYVELLDKNRIQVYQLDSETGLAREKLYDFNIPAPSSIIL